MRHWYQTNTCTQPLPSFKPVRASPRTANRALASSVTSWQGMESGKLLASPSPHHLLTSPYGGCEQFNWADATDIHINEVERTISSRGLIVSPSDSLSVKIKWLNWKSSAYFHNLNCFLGSRTGNRRISRQVKQRSQLLLLRRKIRQSRCIFKRLVHLFVQVIEAFP